jgi:hypothetical protein
VEFSEHRRQKAVHPSDEWEAGHGSQVGPGGSKVADGNARYVHFRGRMYRALLAAK